MLYLWTRKALRSIRYWIGSISSLLRVEAKRMQILSALRWQLFLSVSAESLYSQKIAEIDQRGKRLTQKAAERGWNHSYFLHIE